MIEQCDEYYAEVTKSNITMISLLLNHQQLWFS